MSLTQLGHPTKLPESPDTAVLETVPNPHPGLTYLVRFTCPEFTSLCPVTGQPDFAHFVIDYGPESALFWVVFMDADGACWTVPNAEVRIYYNWSLGRRKPENGHAAEEPKPSPARPLQRFRPTLAGQSDA